VRVGPSRGYSCHEICVEQVLVSVAADGEVAVRTRDAKFEVHNYHASPFFLSSSSYQLTWGEPAPNRRVAREVRRAVRRAMP
ncbi:MAG: hypothetical protein AAGE52_42085, partial [Myxococcota bacterium]